MNNWISVDDELPKEDTDVLAWCEGDDGGYFAVAWHHNSFWFSPSWGDDVSVSHWMTLPASPLSDKR